MSTLADEESNTYKRISSFSGGIFCRHLSPFFQAHHLHRNNKKCVREERTKHKK
jgi:hypothetical protein